MLYANSQLKMFMEQKIKNSYPRQTFCLGAHQEAPSSISLNICTHFGISSMANI